MTHSSNTHPWTASQTAGAIRNECRVALYSHDTMGIGHFRRNLLIAEALRNAPMPTTSLMIAGAREAGLFAVQAGIESLTLPGIRKTDDGSYVSSSRGISFEQLIDVRARTIDAALSAFQPDVLIVDKVPRGAAGELDSALHTLKEQGRTKCVLGLRDVLDDPSTVRREWREADSGQAVRSFYDAVWIYGDRSVYDPLHDSGIAADINGKARYTGYIAPHDRATTVTPACRTDGLPDQPFVLCLVGGGQDGAPLIEAVSRATVPTGMQIVLLTGPFIPAAVRQRLRQDTDRNPRIQVHDFVTDPERFIQHAERVITMGGYNSICELLTFRKPGLVVPRVRPRKEQLIRAERLRDLGLLDVLHPDDVTPEAISDWLAGEIRQPAFQANEVDLQGHLRLPHLLAELLQPSGNSPTSTTPVSEGPQLVSR